MKTPTTFEITADLEASMERDGANYTGNLIVRSEKLDEYDIYRLNPEGYWDLDFDSLTNRADNLELPEAADKNSGGWTGWLWEEVDGFAVWAEEMKSLVPAARVENAKYRIEENTAALEQFHPPEDPRFSAAVSLAEIDWAETEEMQSAGNCPSNLFRGDDGRIYYSLSN